MIKRTLTVVFACLDLAISQVSYSQHEISFGKVSLEELQMTFYKPDTSASAVILSDIGKLNGNQLVFTRHLRIKILDKSGLEFGNWIFNTPTKGDFKIWVFNLENGEIIKEKVDGNSIYREEIIQGFEVYKVFVPNVKVGSVIDIIYSYYGIPFEWRFQDRIPVVYSELILEPSSNINFSKTHFGFEPIETISPYKWRARNVPAFKIEPFLNNYTNYITKFEFQPEWIRIPRLFYIEFSTSWRKIVEVLLADSRFGGILESSAYLNDFAREVKKRDLTIEEKINEAFAFIQKNVKWNEEKSLLATAGIRTNFLVNHSANSAEINLNLISLLNKMGITTYPIVLSTRDNGLLAEYSPLLNKLNYVIAYIQHENVEMFLDATSEYLTPGILPAYCLNSRGLLVKRNNEQWFTLNKGYRDIKKQFIQINIDKEGSVLARIDQELNGYGFLNWSVQQKELDNDENIIKNKLQKDNPGIKILSYKVNKKDIKTITAKETIEIDMTNQLTVADKDIFLNPFMLFEYSSNPFKSESRKYPVDLTYPKELNTTIIVQLPKEYSVKQLPESIKFSNPDGSASFTYLANSNGNNLQFKVLLKLNKYVFTETEYLELRQFFSEVIKAVNTPVQLSKL